MRDTPSTNSTTNTYLESGMTRANVPQDALCAAKRFCNVIKLTPLFGEHTRTLMYCAMFLLQTFDSLRTFKDPIPLLSGCIIYLRIDCF